MPAVRTIAAVLIAATIAVTGCATYSSRGQPSPPSPAPNPTYGPRLPTHRTDPIISVDRQAPIYAAVLRQYLTSGDASFGGHRFPRVSSCSTVRWPASAPQGSLRPEDQSRRLTARRSPRPWPMLGR